MTVLPARARRAALAALAALFVAAAVAWGTAARADLAPSELDALAGQGLQGLSAVPATLEEDQLDMLVGYFTYDGQTHEITARAAIEDTVSLDAALLDDGTYEAPTADMVITCARNRILTMVVDEKGVELSDEELAAYMLQTLGTSDLAQVAAAYGMDEQEARAILVDAARIVKLRDQEIGTIGAAPQPPVAPDAATGSATPTEQYGAYVLGLVGGSWNVVAGEWANASSPYREALEPYGFDGKTATYEMAQVAYYVAYALYQEEAVWQLEAWNDYINAYLGEACLVVLTLRS